MDIERRLRDAVQQYWTIRAISRQKQIGSGKIDAGSRGEVTSGKQMEGFESLVADILVDAGLNRGDIRTRTSLELPGYFRSTKKWDLLAMAGGQLVLAMEFKSQAGKSIGNNVNNRTEEALGSAKDIWTAYREGRFGNSPAPFLGYFFLLEDHPGVRSPVANKTPHFEVDPAFLGEPYEKKVGTAHRGISYAARYELLCRRLVLERLYSAVCFVIATNAAGSVITQPGQDLTFQRLAAALRGHVVAFLGARPR